MHTHCANQNANSHAESAAARNQVHDALGAQMAPGPDGLSGHTDQPGDPYIASPGHLRHALAPAAGAYVPSGHEPQAEYPVIENTPGLQTLHVVDRGSLE